MWAKFCISLFISGLIHHVKCINTPYSDMYLPYGTNGFVCRKDFITIDHARILVNRAFESFFFENYFKKFPKLFEDTHLFDVKSDILLSWPCLPSGKIYVSGKSGKTRLIINTRGQIMGMVILTSDIHNKVTFEKCNPVRSSIDDGNIENKMMNEWWNIYCPLSGYDCGSRFFPISMIKDGDGSDSKYYFQNTFEVKARRTSLKKYTGDRFIGNDLYTYPLHHRSSIEVVSGPPGPFRVVFDMENREFKGITNIEDKNAKCVPVLDMSSVPSNEIYNPSSILNMETMPEKYWPATCFGHKFKYKTMWLYIEFVLKNWPADFYGRGLNFPIVTEDFSLFWPLRTPETHDTNLKYAFAIGYNANLNSYDLYKAVVRDGVLSDFQKSQLHRSRDTPFWCAVRLDPTIPDALSKFFQHITVLMQEDWAFVLRRAIHSFTNVQNLLRICRELLSNPVKLGTLKQYH